MTSVDSNRPYCRYCCLDTSEKVIDVCDCRGNAKMHFSCVRHKIICSADAECLHCRSTFRDNRIKRFGRGVMDVDKEDKRLICLVAIISLVWFSYQIYSSNLLNEGIREMVSSRSHFFKQQTCPLDPNRDQPKCQKCLEAYRRIRSKSLSLEEVCDECSASYENLANPIPCPECPKAAKQTPVCKYCSKKMPEFSVDCYCGQCLKKLAPVCAKCAAIHHVKNGIAPTKTKYKPSSRQFALMASFCKPLFVLAISYWVFKYLRNSTRDWKADQLKDFEIVTLESCVNGNGQRLRKLRLFIKENEVFVQQLEESLFRCLRLSSSADSQQVVRRM